MVYPERTPGAFCKPLPGGLRHGIIKPGKNAGANQEGGDEHTSP